MLDGDSALPSFLALFGGEGGVELVKSVSDLAVLLYDQFFDGLLPLGPRGEEVWFALHLLVSDQEAAFRQRGLFVTACVNLGPGRRLLAIVVATRASLDKLCGQFLDWRARRLVEVGILYHVVGVTWTSVDALQGLIPLVVWLLCLVPPL